MGNGVRTLLGATVLAVAAITSGSGGARADGAVAVGSTGNVVRDGIAFGMVVDEPKETAEATAIKRCRTFQARAAAERCKIVATFAGECFAVAYDPQPGTPGAGWGVGPHQLAANEKALAMCEETAGPARKGYCRVETGGCDTTGQQAAPGEAPQVPAKPGGASDAAPPAQPGAPAATNRDQTRAPMPRTPARSASRAGEERGHGPAGSSPALLFGAMAGVGLAYALGLWMKGKLSPGLVGPAPDRTAGKAEGRPAGKPLGQPPGQPLGKAEGKAGAKAAGKAPGKAGDTATTQPASNPQGGNAERHMMVGGGITVAAGVLMKLLDLAASGQTVIIAVAGLFALAAAYLA